MGLLLHPPLLAGEDDRREDLERGKLVPSRAGSRGGLRGYAWPRCRLAHHVSTLFLDALLGPALPGAADVVVCLPAAVAE